VLGSTIIFEPTQAKLKIIADNIEAAYDFEHLNLETLTTIDFISIIGKTGIPWSIGEPVVLKESEDGGLVVVQISPQGIEYVLSNPGDLNTLQLEDLTNLKIFTQSFGNDNIYEMVAW
jgi:hypothetical protein